MAFPGKDQTKQQYARLTSLVIAIWGAHFNAAGKFITGGLRKPVKIERETSGPKDITTGEIVDRVKVKFSGEFLQTSLVYIQNAYLLSKQFVQLQAENVHGQWINFVDNGGTFASPTGSALLAFGFTFTLSESERSLAFECDTEMSDTEWSWLVTNSTSAATGGASGPAVTLAAQVYDKEEYVRSGIHKITCTVTGGTEEDMGMYSKAKLVVKSVAQEKDDRLRAQNAYLDLSLDATFLETDTASLAAISAEIEGDDCAFTVYDWNDNKFVLATGAGRGTAKLLWSDEHNTWTLSVKGRIVYNPDETASPLPYVDIGIADAATATFKLAGY